MNETPLISVIVPAYNVEQNIVKCLDSILNQTYENIEVLVCDDCSLDDTPNLIKLKMESDSRLVCLFHQVNKGVAKTRNDLLKLANGKYICFVDSDDYVEYDFIQRLFDAIQVNDADLAVCGFYIHRGMNISVHNDTCGYIPLDAFRKLVIADCCSSYMTNKMFKRQLFENVLFEDEIVWEDLEWFARVLPFLERGAEFTDRPLYHYIIHAGSITQSQERLIFKTGCIAYAFCERYLIAQQLADEVLCEIAVAKLINHVISYYCVKINFELNRGGHGDDATLPKWCDEKIELVFNSISSLDVIRCKPMSIRYKLKYLSYKIAPRVYVLLFPKIKGCLLGLTHILFAWRKAK